MAEEEIPRNPLEDDLDRSLLERVMEAYMRESEEMINKTVEECRAAGMPKQMIREMCREIVERLEPIFAESIAATEQREKKGADYN